MAVGVKERLAVFSNPLNRAPGELWTADDFHALVANGVEESWTVEFKREPPGGKNRALKIAQSIAALANTHGGWYIVGVEAEERSDEGRRCRSVAKGVPGFDTALFGDPVELVRNAVRDHIQPLPLFFSQALPLSEGRMALVVGVPSDQETPFITTDGRVYRRVAASSDPIHETDRYAFDRLVDRGRGIAAQFARFCRDERTLAPEWIDPDERPAWVQIYLSPHPRGTIFKPEVVTQPGIRSLLQRSRISRAQNGFQGAFELDYGQPTPESAVLRPRTNGQHRFAALAVELFIDGRAKLLIPLQHAKHLDLPLLREQLDHFQSQQARWALSAAIQELPNAHDGMQPRLFDTGQLWLTVGALVGFYLDWIGDMGALPDLRGAVRSVGAWRSAPFRDSDVWGEYARGFGLPMMLSDVVEVPAGIGSGLRLDWGSNLWMDLALHIGLTFGLPTEISALLLEEAASHNVRSGGLKF